MKNFRSYRNIDFTKEFIFEFLVKNNKNSDFDFSFGVACDDIEKSNSLRITNTPEGYITEADSNNNYEFTSKKYPLTEDIENNYFDEIIIIHNKTPFKKFENEKRNEIKNYFLKDNITYISTDRYSVSTESSNDITIKRVNSKNKEGLFIRPIELKQIEVSATSDILYVNDSESPFDFNYPQTYRIIVSDKARNISLWHWKNNKFNRIKTFTYSKSIEKGIVTLSIANDTNLANLRFSFFEA